jgi:SAM-dependent methyltransferase
MRIPTEEDFRRLEEWGLIADPLAAVEDFSADRAKRRVDNDRHCRKRDEFEANRSSGFLDDAVSYYEGLERPIDRTKWAYLKRRKAWFHPPLGWGRLASPGTSRILDLGCGDGDQTQRVAEFVAGRWQASGYDGFPLEVVGVDICASRIENARRHTNSPHEKITLRFEQGDALAGLDYSPDFFDYTVVMGLFEFLNDDQLDTTLEEITRLTAHGLYVRDMLEEYPGFYPRPKLPDTVSSHGFEPVERARVFEEPFVESGTRDPLDVWPMHVHQVLFAEREDPVDRADRY